jgi:glycine hydroxymethyltransferase
MILVDLTTYGIGNGVFAQDALDAAGITMNKNTVPNDPSSPFYPSGLRLGTPALTTRGMKEEEMRVIGGFIAEVLEEIKPYKLPSGKEERTAYIKNAKKELGSNAKILETREKVRQLCTKFPLYPNMEL